MAPKATNALIAMPIQSYHSTGQRQASAPGVPCAMNNVDVTQRYHNMRWCAVP